MKEKDNIDITAEIWEDAIGFEKFYQVSSFGRVRSLDRKRNAGRNGGFYIQRGRILKQGFDKDGYKTVGLGINGHKIYQHVHQMVALAFIPNPNKLPEVNHKDENKANNRVDNLEWITQKDNINYGTGVARRSRSQSKPVLQFSLDGILLKRWDTAQDAALQVFNGNSKFIRACCHGRIHTAHGFQWRYAENNITTIQPYLPRPCDITKYRKRYGAA